MKAPLARPLVWSCPDGNPNPHQPGGRNLPLSTTPEGSTK
jgi:hypothetical protein